MADSIIKKHKLAMDFDSEDAVGGHFEGVSKRERDVGIQKEVVVDIFQRRNKTFFVRISLRSQIRPTIITRHEVDFDKYSSEWEFLSEVRLGAGAVAERQCEMFGDGWDPEYVANQAAEAARELLSDSKEDANQI